MSHSSSATQPSSQSNDSQSTATTATSTNNGFLNTMLPDIGKLKNAVIRGTNKVVTTAKDGYQKIQNLIPDSNTHGTVFKLLPPEIYDKIKLNNTTTQQLIIRKPTPIKFRTLGGNDVPFTAPVIEWDSNNTKMKEQLENAMLRFSLPEFVLVVEDGDNSKLKELYKNVLCPLSISPKLKNNY